MFRIQWVQEPLAPWSSTSGGPSPQLCHTTEPASVGVTERVARTSIRETNPGASSISSLDTADETCVK